jgi:hypothetical protein
MEVPTVLFLLCPLRALILGLSVGVLLQRWWLGSVTGAAMIAIPLLTGFDWNPILLIYALSYAIVGLLGSSIGTGLMRWLSRRLRSRRGNGLLKRGN